jgi:hypothetical protein
MLDAYARFTLLKISNFQRRTIRVDQIGARDHRVRGFRFAGVLVVLLHSCGRPVSYSAF